jgi:hypothetical protein
VAINHLRHPPLQPVCVTPAPFNPQDHPMMNATEEAGLRQALAQVEALISRLLQSPMPLDKTAIEKMRHRAQQLRSLIEQGAAK